MTSDTTSLWTQEGWLDLPVVLDWFSHMVVGWSMAAIQDAALVINALTMALVRRCPPAGWLLHSDPGRTSTSESYLVLFKQNGRQASMSRTANCSENAARDQPL